MRDIFEHIEEDFQLLDRTAIFALVYSAIGLTCISYLKNADFLELAAAFLSLSNIAQAIERTNASNLGMLGYWVAVSLLFYFVLPVAFIRVVLQRPLSEFGLKFSIEKGFWQLLIKCLIFMLPLVYLMSLTHGFSAKYPFLKIYDGSPYLSSTLFLWEMIYFLQFFGLEFFFRGFLLQSMKPAIGIYSIFVMMVPYCTIHWGKPMPEAFAAIFAGIFLGWLSYHNGNIWMGLILHCFVAFSMDAMALFNKGLLF